MSESLIDDANFVEKANCLTLMYEDYFDLEELKIFDIYLSKINPRDTTNTEVVFSKRTLEKLLGKERIRPAVLEQRVNNLMQTITIRNPDKDSEIPWLKINLFDASWIQQNKSGEYELHLRCSASSREYIFGIEGIGYMRYQLKNVTQLTSKYSFYLYLYIQRNMFRAEWEVSIEQFKNEIHCTSKMFEDFRHLNNRILIPCIQELNQKTDLSISYTKKTGSKNKTIGLIFTACSRGASKNFIEDENERFRTANIDRIHEISEILEIDENGALAIMKESARYTLSYEDTKERVLYVKSRGNIENVVGYTISILNPRKWSGVQKQPKKHFGSEREYSKAFFETFMEESTSHLYEESASS